MDEEDDCLVKRCHCLQTLMGHYFILKYHFLGSCAN